jgi:hypothetical protein
MAAGPHFTAPARTVQKPQLTSYSTVTLRSRYLVMAVSLAQQFLPKENITQYVRSDEHGDFQ